MDYIEVFRIIGGAFFAIEFVAYAIFGLVYAGDSWHPFSEMMFSHMVVSGIGTLIYAYLLDAGSNVAYVWIAYAISCAFLVISIYRWLTLGADKDVIGTRVERLPPYTYYHMQVVTVITLLGGFVINFIPSLGYRIAAYAFLFIPYVFILLFLWRSVRLVLDDDVSGKVWVKWFVGVTLFFWLAYPVGLAMGPQFGGLLNGREEGFVYLLADIITKHVFMAVSAISVGWYVREHGGTSPASARVLRT